MNTQVETMLMAHNTINSYPPAEDTPIVSEKTKFRTTIACKIIHEQYHRKIYVQELASACHMSADHFSRIFKQEHGRTVREYIKSYRIDRACILLTDTRLSIQQIARMSGFEDASFFNRLFRNTLQTTPTQFREQSSGAEQAAPSVTQAPNQTPI